MFKIYFKMNWKYKAVKMSTKLEFLQISQG